MTTNPGIGGLAVGLKSVSRIGIPISCLLFLLTGCRTAPAPTATDADLGRLASSARKVFDMGEPARAIPLYREALQRARALNDDAAVGAVGANLAACLFDAGALDAARETVREARDGLRRAKRPEADAALLEGRIALAQGRADDARAAVASLAAMPSPTRTSRIAAALLAADLALATDDFPGARAAIDTAARLTGPDDDASLLAWQAEARARTLLAADAPSGAAAAFEDAARHRGHASQAPRVAANLLAAAAAHAKAGNKAGEADCLYRTARAFVAAHRVAEARPLLNRAASLAAETPEAAGLRPLIDALAQELAAGSKGP